MPQDDTATPTAPIALDAYEQLAVSPKMVERARERVGDKARIEQADLGADLDRFDDADFDLVLGSLVLDYVRDVASVFRQFRRLLRPDGHLVFSVLHPLAAQLIFEPDDYFATEEVSSEWTGFGTPVAAPSCHRPLGEWTEALASAGFVIERMVEAKPTQEFRAQDPEQYEELSRRPSFLCVRAARG